MNPRMTQTVIRCQRKVTAMSRSCSRPSEILASAMHTVDTVLAAMSQRTAGAMSAARPDMIMPSSVWPQPYSAETCRRTPETPARSCVSEKTSWLASIAFFFFGDCICSCSW